MRIEELDAESKKQGRPPLELKGWGTLWRGSGSRVDGWAVTFAD